MKMIGIESSGLVASVAIAEDETLIAEYTMNHKKTHSQTLLPMLDEIVSMAEVDLGEVDGIAISKGPGSFTGLRIGASTAKGLALALSKPIVPVPTLEAMAYGLWGCDKVICPLIDARRETVYAGIYRLRGERPEVVKDQHAVDINELIDALNTIGEDVVFLGDGASVYEDVIRQNASVNIEFAPAMLNRQRAANVALLGIEYMKAGIFEDGDMFAPDYIRIGEYKKRNDA